MRAVDSGKFDTVLKQQVEEIGYYHPVADLSASKAEEIFQNVIQSPLPEGDKPQSEPRPRKLIPLVGVAASVLLVFAIGLAIYMQQFDGNNRQEVIMPGADKAVLTLADGTQVALDSVAKGSLYNQGGVQVIDSGGNVAYTAAPVATGETMYNTITTPRGGQYKVIMADGTQVWLNAASSLRYPVTSGSGRRVAELAGEAYFEVTSMKNPEGEGKLPFIVEVADMQVEVLGTHFNVMAYGDEPAIQTTLLEGAVRVSDGDSELLLKPGQQAQLAKEKGLSLSRQVDIRAVLAWKNGYFRYNDTGIITIMNQISRWYDVQIEYDSPQIRQLNFGGVVSRKDQVNAMLDLMELTGVVHFEIKGRTILIKEGMPQQKE